MSSAEPFTRLAEVYDAFYVPAVLREWAGVVVEAAGVEEGDSVLDVACGTGVVARTALPTVRAAGRVVGVDPNRGMLSVARRKEPSVEWHEGGVDRLPFPDGAFDGVTCQFGLMFFPDRPGAVREMMRVLRPQGRLVVAVWASLDEFAVYSELAQLLRERYRPELLDEFAVPHSLGDPAQLHDIFSRAGIEQVDVQKKTATARFPSLREWLWIEVKEWLLGDAMDEGAFQDLLADAEERFRRFVARDGTLTAPAPGYLVSADRP